MKTDLIKVKVSKVVDMPCTHSKVFTFSSCDGKALPFFRAGQYVSLRLNIGNSCVTRPYSLSSSPSDAEKGSYEICVQDNPGGFAASWMLENFTEGFELEVSAPLGKFYHDYENDAPNVVSLAGGSGITPFLSMARAIRDGLEDFDLTILNGNRTEDSVFFKAELDEIARTTDKVHVVNVLSDEDKVGFEHGFLTADLVKKYGKDDYSVYICGPEAMYKFLSTEMMKFGLPSSRIRSEAPGVTRSVAQDPGFPKDSVGKTYTVTVRMGESEYRIPAISEEPVLVALERAGIKAPSHCRSGVCAWCSSRLVEGQLFMPELNDKRTEEEKAKGLVHVCASFPVSDLTLEVPLV